jgi:hypothetical protein
MHQRTGSGIKVLLTGFLARVLAASGEIVSQTALFSSVTKGGKIVKLSME